MEPGGLEHTSLPSSKDGCSSIETTAPCEEYTPIYINVLVGDMEPSSTETPILLIQISWQTLKPFGRTPGQGIEPRTAWLTAKLPHHAGPPGTMDSGGVEPPKQTMPAVAGVPFKSTNPRRGGNPFGQTGATCPCSNTP